MEEGVETHLDEPKDSEPNPDRARRSTRTRGTTKGSTNLQRKRALAGRNNVSAMNDMCDWTLDINEDLTYIRGPIASLNEIEKRESCDLSTRAICIRRQTLRYKRGMRSV